MENLLWTNSNKGSKAIIMVIALLASIWVVIPFLWAIDNSFKTPAEIFKSGAFIPFLQFAPTLDTWKEVLGDPQALNCLFSSTIVGVGTTLLVLLIGTPAAYSLARFEFKMKSRDITLWFLSQRVLPPVVVLTPFYILLAQVGLIDTWIGLIILYSTFNLAFCVVIMRDIFRDVSKEVEEAASLELPRLEKNLVFLSTIASVATLMGLLGTVIGMITSFAALGDSGGGEAAGGGQAGAAGKEGENVVEAEFEEVKDEDKDKKDKDGDK